MTDFECKIIVIAIGEFLAGVIAAYYLGHRNGAKRGYDRGFIAARLRYEIPRDEHGKFVKRQP